MVELTKEEQMKAISDGVKEAFLIVFQFTAVRQDDLEFAIRSGIMDAALIKAEAD